MGLACILAIFAFFFSCAAFSCAANAVPFTDVVIRWISFWTTYPLEPEGEAHLGRSMASEGRAEPATEPPATHLAFAFVLQTKRLVGNLLILPIQGDPERKSCEL
jgi:hypothetical protein